MPMRAPDFWHEPPGLAAALLAQSQEAHLRGDHLGGVELAEQAVNSVAATDAPVLLPQAYSLLASHRWRLGQRLPPSCIRIR